MLVDTRLPTRPQSSNPLRHLKSFEEIHEQVPASRILVTEGVTLGLKLKLLKPSAAIIHGAIDLFPRGRGIPLQDLADRVGLSKAATRNHLAVLVDFGFVLRTQEAGETARMLALRSPGVAVGELTKPQMATLHAAQIKWDAAVKEASNGL